MREDDIMNVNGHLYSIGHPRMIELNMKLKMKKIRLRSRGEDKFYKTPTLLIGLSLCFSRDAYSKLVQRRSEYESSGSEAAEISYNAQIKVRMCSSNR